MTPRHAADSAAPARIATIIVNYRTAELALASLGALAGERDALPTLRAVIVDGGSGDDSAERIAAGLRDPGFTGWATALPLSTNGGFGWANNQAMLRLLQSDAPPDYIHLLNPDALVEPGAVARLAEELDAHPRAAAVGSQLLNADGSRTGSAFRFPSVARELARGANIGAIEKLLRIEPTTADRDTAGEVDWVTGASVMLRAAALREVGLFDTGFFLYFEETELMWRLSRAGWTVRQQPLSRVRHVGGASTGMTYSQPDLARHPPHPRYWYESRRRLLALTRGRLATVTASLAWAAGHALRTMRRAARLGDAAAPVEREARNLIVCGIRPRPKDLRPAFTPADQPPGRPPAWMTN